MGEDLEIKDDRLHWLFNVKRILRSITCDISNQMPMSWSQTYRHIEHDKVKKNKLCLRHTEIGTQSICSLKLQNRSETDLNISENS